MASGTRSSKRKSSPSLKKKHRIKDRSKKRSKLGVGKSRKVYRRESPDSYSDDESLLSSDSKLPCSTSDSDSRRRSRSRTRKDTSKRRKKSRGHRLRSESSEERKRKSKRSKKKSKDIDAKKKRLGRKRRRELSASSSSRSVSCSTCESSDDIEKEHKRIEKRRGRSRRDLDEVGDSYRIEDQVLVENNPRRLRSVIIFAKECEEADKELLDTDVHKEEIIYDHDEYPSPKSNDSNDGDNKREAYHLRTGYLEDQHEKMVGSKVGGSELSERSNLVVIERDVNASTDTGSNASDLEAVLRLKALENLRKFKGGLRGNAKKPVSIKSSNDGEVKHSSDPNNDLECQKKDQEGSVGGVTAFSVPRQNISTVEQHSILNLPAAETLQTLPPNLEMVNPPKEGSADDAVDTSKGGEKEGHLGSNKIAKQVLFTQDSSVLNIPTTESSSFPLKDAKRLADSVADVNEKHESGASTLIKCQTTPIPESSVPVSVPAESKGTTENVQTFHGTKLETDADKTTTGGETSNAKENKEDSQFQQKTMSVMRGGEMVQVSYKVYIPKNAPALARRKLKR